MALDRGRKRGGIYRQTRPDDREVRPTVAKTLREAPSGAQRRRQARTIVDDLIAGRVEGPDAAAALGSLGLTAAEKKQVRRQSGRASREQQREIGGRLANAVLTPVQFPFTFQTAGTTGRNIRENLDELAGGRRGARGARLSVGDAVAAGELDIGMAAWVPGGRIPFKRGANKDLPPVADEAVDATDEAAAKVVGSLPEARRLRGKQERLYRAERGKRGAASEDVARQVGGREGYRAALAELKGDLPKLKFGALEGEIDQPMADRLFSHIQGRDDLRAYDKLNAQRALANVLEGRVPTRGDIRMLERVFGPDTAAQIKESLPFWKKAKDLGLQVINVPRALKASFDLSAPFRQGLVLGARHPRMFGSEFKPMLKSFASEGAYRDVMDDIASRPTFEAMQKAKLALTDLEGLSTREEQFMSNLAEHIPVAGRGVRASGRAYTAFLNKFRADAFDNYLLLAEKQGRDITDEKLLRSIASWVNHATGRGSLGRFESSAVELNALLFSPRLIASRLQLLNPVYYGKLDPFARRQALQGMAQLLGGVSLTLYLAKIGGADVGVDPRSADFGKIKVGDTRVDVMGGFQQYIVAASRLVKGEIVSSSSGELVRLEGGFAEPSRADILQRFGEQKLAPVPAFINAALKNENFEGDPFNPGREFGRLFVPLGWESAYDTYQSTGNVPATAAGLGLGSIGFGVQTYGPEGGSSRRRSGGGGGVYGNSRRGGGGGIYGR